MNGFLSCQNLAKSFHAKNAVVPALREVSFTLASNEFVSVVGPSGCGKTTLLKIIAGLMAPTAGQIEHARTDRERLRTALVFQDHGLFPWMDVCDNVAFGLEAMGLVRAERRRRARDFIERLGLGHFADLYPRTLSIGMRQRVGIARALVSEPELLLLDEPFGSLDAQTKIVLQDELLRLWKDRNIPVILVTHDIEEAVVLSDRVLVMSGRPGTILEDIFIPLERPRAGVVRENPEVIRIKHHIWNLLRDEVRSSLNLRD